MRKKMLAKLADLKLELRRRWHQPAREQGAYLKAVLEGHYRYYGVPRNRPAMRRFRLAVMDLWWRTLGAAQFTAAQVAPDDRLHC